LYIAATICTETQGLTWFSPAVKYAGFCRQMEVKLSLFLIEPYDDIQGKSGVFLTLVSGHLHALAASQGKSPCYPLNIWLGGTESKFGFKEKNFLPPGDWGLISQLLSL